MSSSQSERTPLIDRSGLPLPIGSSQVQDHPIFLRACHSPWPWLGQSGLVYIRGLILAYLTALSGMLLDYKIKYEYGEDEEKTAWCTLFEFSTVAFVLLWLYHFIVFFWSFTHLFYPDIEEEDQRWESTVIKKLSPPVQTPQSRKRFYFSVFFTIVHVFAIMNCVIYWTVLVPLGYGKFPGAGGGDGGDDGDAGEGGEESASITSAEDFFGDYWFQPYCLINLYCITGLIAIFEILVLNSIKRQVPVGSHIFFVAFVLSAYLGWAAFGKLFTGEYPFFWMDREEVEKTEYIASYVSGFVSLGLTVFAFIYGLIGMRENLCDKGSQGQSPSQPSQNSRQVLLAEEQSPE
ncbi:hypothetical protein QBC42DRAFT_322538 [Cladorrhinum samala]|uniref:Uncharacterized protein n=1 Tax=Cladorrhinum samala TaxID=585594 RepID=A0AAV9HTE8_9PEZI|nr:hypothetical protein QBC42DRAFT_322538 [Cladorrhinum samala]